VGESRWPSRRAAARAACGDGVRGHAGVVKDLR